MQNDPRTLLRLLEKLDEGFDSFPLAQEPAGQTHHAQDSLDDCQSNHLVDRCVPLHDYGCSLKAYRRESLEDVHLYGEMHRIEAGEYVPIMGHRVPANRR